MCFLANYVDNSVLEEIVKLCRDIESNPWSILVGKFLDGPKKDICR